MAAIDPKVLRVAMHALKNPTEVGADPQQPYLWQHGDARGLDADGGPALDAAIERGKTEGGYSDLSDPATMADYRVLCAYSLMMADKLSTEPPLVVPSAGGQPSVVIRPRRSDQYATQERARAAGLLVRTVAAFGQRATIIAQNGDVPISMQRQFRTDGGKPATTVLSASLPNQSLVGPLPVVAYWLIAGTIVVVAGIWVVGQVIQNGQNQATQIQIAAGHDLIASKASVSLEVLRDWEKTNPGQPFGPAQLQVLGMQQQAVSQYIAQMPQPEKGPLPTGDQLVGLAGKVILWGGIGYAGYKIVSAFMSKPEPVKMIEHVSAAHSQDSKEIG